MKLRSVAVAASFLPFVALLACGKSTTSGTAVSTTEIHSGTLSSAVPGIGQDCKSDYECPSTGGDGCDWVCQPTKQAGKKACVLLAQGGGVGSTACYGDELDNTTNYYFTNDEDVKRGVICDVANGARCDRKSRACVKVAAIGEACSQHLDCGKDGDCASGKCVARAAVGVSCKDIGCAVGLGCDHKTETCKTLTANGAKCSAHDDCASKYCKGSTCADHPATPACTL